MALDDGRLQKSTAPKDSAPRQGLAEDLLVDAENERPNPEWFSKFRHSALGLCEGELAHSARIGRGPARTLREG